MSAISTHWPRHRGRVAGALTLVAALILTAGCSLSKLVGGVPAATTATANPSALVPGHWATPDFPQVSNRAAGQVVFAFDNPAVGYACVNDAPSLGSSATTGAPLPAHLSSTSDGGQHWQAIAGPALSGGFNCASSALSAGDPASASDVILLTNTLAPGALSTTNPSQQSSLALWRSQDGGQHWQSLTMPRPQQLPSGVTLGMNPTRLMVLASGNQIFLGTATLGVGAAVYVSLNSGKGWDNGSTGPGNGETFLSIATGASGSLLALATPAPGLVSSQSRLDLWQSIDGVTWTLMSTLPAAPTSTGLSFGAVLMSAPHGKALAVMLPLSPFVQTISPSAQGVVSPRLLRSFDSGATWTVITLPADPQTQQPYGLSAVVLASGTGITITDDGSLWATPCVTDDLSQSNALDSLGIYRLSPSVSQWVRVTYPPTQPIVDLSFLTVVTVGQQQTIWTAYSFNIMPDPSIYAFVLPAQA